MARDEPVPPGRAAQRAAADEHAMPPLAAAPVRSAAHDTLPSQNVSRNRSFPSLPPLISLCSPTSPRPSRSPTSLHGTRVVRVRVRARTHGVGPAVRVHTT